MTCFSRFVPIFLILVANTAKFVSAVACTPSQLQGDFNSFRTTGGGGHFNPGSNQIVSYDHPTGSPVTGLTSITIVPFGANSPIYDPNINSGIPSPFSVNGPDVGGYVNLDLPSNLPAGSFVYRLALSTTSGSCTLDSVPFTSTGDDIPSGCSIGQSQCKSSTTYVNCVSTPGGNVFGGVLQTCSPATSCVQSGSVAVCTFGNPGGTCTLGNFRCVGTGFQQCFQSATGNDWTTTQACAVGTVCSLNGASITCAATDSQNGQCTLSSNRCVGTSEFQICEIGPLGNTVWSTSQGCSAGTVCTGSGQCTLGTGTGCTPGYMRCINSGTWEQCSITAEGDWAFGVSQSCAPGTTCNSYLDNYIVCS